MKNAAVSPIATALFIFGIFLLVIPPVGIVLVLAAIAVQAGYRGSKSGAVRAQRHAMFVKAQTRQRSEKAAAFRSLS